ncbi:hypothetical protein F5Y15DRAFT_171147 [Xylariaceae sp. FL0016]|nr:hypothetical protein F5Y15DRAFT_171147 [Xylariaceae sp. FL0016]
MEGATSSSPSLVWTAEHNAYTLSASAIEHESLSELQEALALAREFFPKLDMDYQGFREEVFRDILSRGPLDMVLHMLDKQGVPVSAVDPLSIHQWVTRPLVEALLARGWDINTQDSRAFREQRLIDYLVKARNDKEELARWLVSEKGAHVNGPQLNLAHGPGFLSSPILEICAAFGTVPMFKFLEEHGAILSPRALHVSVDSAASEGVDPDSKSDSLDQTNKATSTKWRSEMLRYLVHERHLDVNALDTSARHENRGTPLNYAAHWQKGAPVVSWLLEMGANPSICDPSGRDAEGFARESRCDKVLGVLEDWKKSRNQDPIRNSLTDST